jgi:hypothetical protein
VGWALSWLRSRLWRAAGGEGTAWEGLGMTWGGVGAAGATAGSSRDIFSCMHASPNCKPPKPTHPPTHPQTYPPRPPTHHTRAGGQGDAVRRGRRRQGV